MIERKICNNCTHQKLVGVSITCQRCFNKSLWRARSKTMTEELKQKAKEWCKSKNFTPSNVGYFAADYCEQSYIAGATEKTKELQDEVRKLKILISSLVYEINQIWDINEMNDDLRVCAEKIDREVQLSKMAEDNRMVISALGFAIVPQKPKLDVKEI